MSVWVRIAAASAVLALVASPGCGKSSSAAEGASSGAPADSAEARVSATKAQLEHAAKAVIKFHKKHNKLPGTLDELLASRALHFQKSADPWGQKFEVMASADKTSVDVCSGGPDMAVGSDDDICKTVSP